MARIQYDPETIGGNMMAEAVDHARKMKDLFDRAKAMADQRSNGGSNKAALEGSAEFAVGTGQGAAFYDLLAGFIFNSAALTSTDIAAVDMGD